MKKILFLLIILASKSLIGQTTTTEALTFENLNGEWIWVESRNSRVKNPESEKIEIKIIIKDCSIIEVYLDEKIEEILTFEIKKIEDKSINKNLEKIWVHYHIEYKIIKRNLPINKNKIEKYISITDTGTLAIWNNEHIELKDTYISGTTISKFIKIE